MTEIGADLPQQINNIPENELHLVPSSTRLLNHIVDSLVGGLLINIVMKLFHLDFKLDGPINNYQDMMPLIKFDLLGMGIMFIYYMVTESLTGQTFGKVITKTRVVDDYGHKPTPFRVLIRTLCRFIPLEAISFLFSPIGWHDSISKTYVVKNKS
ncbi:RDD family protein [Solitalea koreensis]|uniref:Uncharacterized membrane protein YckC, RDD family n=1 Tax=Solitalea koreensis TaxID=543615 RepID=A0A521BL16_9SPHI|nr:RDD family protein [Solitalea koreensis]SMO47854.1 Uncharacterized membrane protein YckC, RDD family [Solitalea koreensis]